MLCNSCGNNKFFKLLEEFEFTKRPDEPWACSELISSHWARNVWCGKDIAEQK